MKSYLVFIAHQVNPISTRTLEEIKSKIGDNRADELYLVIETSGGEPFSGVEIMNVLKSRFSKISAIVPRYAKSTGTLMAIGADRIYMNKNSFLEPLDLPMGYTSDGSKISSLDMQNTIKRMADLLNPIPEHILSLPKVSKLLIPTEQIDPYKLRKAHREMEERFNYAIDKLLKKMLKGKTAIATDRIKKLVKNFPERDNPIYNDEAARILGLTVKDIKTLEIWNSTLKPIYTKAKNNIYSIEYGTLQEDAS